MITTLDTLLHKSKNVHWLRELWNWVDALVTEEINVLESRLETQEYRLQQYEDDLSELKKQIQHNMNLFDALPTTCFKVATNFEQ